MTDLRPLSILVVEDQALIAMELQMLIEDAGHSSSGWATDRREADVIAGRTVIDLALVDIHLADGPTGGHVAADLRRRNIPVVFMTANAKRVPEDFAGAIGILAKPYTASAVAAVLEYLHSGVLDPPPCLGLPSGLTLSPMFAERWAFT